MSVAKSIFNISLIIVTVIMTFVSGVLLYYKTLGQDKLPTAITTTHVTNVTDPQTGEEKPFIEVNYYANNVADKDGNKKGYEVFELQFNAYTGVGKQGIYSRGFQMVFDEKGELIKYTNEVGNESDIYHYDNNGVCSFISGHEYQWGDAMLTNIDGKLYGVKLDGTKKNEYYTKNLGNFCKWFFTGGMLAGKIDEKTGNSRYVGDYHCDYVPVTFADFINYLRIAIKSCSAGTGDYVVPLMDLGNYLSVYELKDGQIAGEKIGEGTLKNAFFTVGVHYDNRGMVWTKQSMFGSVAGDSQFNVSGLLDNVDYWQAITQCILTQNDFTARYVQSENGSYYTLSADKINEIKNFEDTEIVVDFDISKFSNVNVLGFDYYALSGVKIKQLNIHSKTQRDFKLMVSSLKDTGLTADRIITNNVRINNVNSGVEL